MGWWDRRKRRKAGLPETDHLVELVQGDPGEGPSGLFVMAFCAEPGCEWMESSSESGLQRQADDLRVIAAKHSTNVAREIVVPGKEFNNGDPDH